MKGILLAGGTGTRLFPATVPVSKQLLPVYDKPLIYYPLTTLMLAGISEVLVITTEQDMDQFRLLLRDGSQWGLDINLRGSERGTRHPGGIADRARLHRRRLGCARARRQYLLRLSTDGTAAASLYTERGRLDLRAHRPDPERFGVVTLDRDGGVIEIVEKPKHPESNLAVVGLYFYDRHVADHAADLKPLGAWRAGDHRPQPRLPRTGRAARGAARPRHGVDRRRNGGLAAPGGELHPEHREAAGDASRLARGDRVASWLHRRRRVGTTGGRHLQFGVRTVPAGHP